MVALPAIGAGPYAGLALALGLLFVVCGALLVRRHLLHDSD